MKIYRYEIPTDGDWYREPSVGDPLHIAFCDRNAVQFWAWKVEQDYSISRYFRVYEDGQDIPDNVKYWGTASLPMDPHPGLHLVEAVGVLHDELTEHFRKLGH